MKRTALFLLVVGLTGSLALYAQMRGGSGQRGGMQRGGGPQMSGPQHGPMGQPQMQQERRQSRAEECEHWCAKAREEARHLERYCEASRFEPATARQLGQQLADRLQAMEEHHAALRERLTADERERQQKRLQAMDASQQRWREAFADLERELGQPEPGRETVRRHARTIEKELKKFQKEMQGLETSPGD